MSAEPAVLLAWVMVGEAGVLGTVGMELIAGVVFARMLSPDYPDTVHGVVVDGFNGLALPDEATLLLARRLYDDFQAKLFRDVSLPWRMLFVFSEEDRVMLGCSTGDRVYSTEVASLHLYQDFCVKGAVGG